LQELTCRGPDVRFVADGRPSLWQAVPVEGQSVTGYARKYALIALAFAASACTSLPDTSGYTAATSELSTAIGSAGDLTHAQLVAAAADIQTPEVRQTAQQNAVQFREAWDRTSGASRRMVDYAESIEAITASASAAAGDIDAVAASLGEVANAAGLTNPLTSATGGMFVGLAREVWSQIRIAQSASDLEATLAAADPAIQRITVHLQQQVADIDLLWRATMNARESRLFGRYGNVAAAYEQLNTDYGALLADYSAAQGADRGRLGQAIETMRPQYEAARQIAEQYARENMELTATRDRGLRLIAATTSALDSWRRAHDRLRTAIEERKPFSVQSLVAAARRVRAVVDEARNQQEQ
jgi:hypothetical protein